MELFNELPEWLQNKIEDAPEWQEVDDEEEAAPAASPTTKPTQAKQQELATDEIPIDDVPF